MNHKFGIYFSKWSVGHQLIGVGLEWTAEKYVYFSLFNLELAIGYTAR